MKKFVLMTLTIVTMLCMNITSFAADPYSPHWEIDSNQTWHYRMNDGTYATDAWIHDEVNGDWYLLDVNGDMLSGVFVSYGKYYYLDPVRGTGHFGRLLKNGQSINGVTIKASTNAEDEGALSADTVRALGIGTNGVTEVSGTKHIASGAVTNAGTAIDSMTLSSGIQCVATDRVRLRATPSTDDANNILATMDAGTVFEYVRDYNDDWAVVRMNGAEVYVGRHYIVIK